VTLRLVRSKKKQTEGVREWRAGCPAERSETKKKRASGRLTPPRGPDRSEAESDAAERVSVLTSRQSQAGHLHPTRPHATALFTWTSRSENSTPRGDRDVTGGKYRTGCPPSHASPSSTEGEATSQKADPANTLWSSVLVDTDPPGRLSTED